MFDNETILNQLKTFSGSYEMHISVKEDVSLDLFYKICEKFNSKALVINLSKGTTKNQPMLCKKLNGLPYDVYDSIKKIYCGVSEIIKISRLKIEADILNTGIPELDEDAEVLPDYCYFEHHIRLILDNNTNLNNLSYELSQYNGHLSKNELSNDKNFGNRFVTQRFYKMGNKTAKNKLEEMCKFIESQKIQYDKKIREYNIYDSNSMLDYGWIK